MLSNDYYILTYSDRPLKILKRKLFNRLPSIYNNHNSVARFLFILILNSFYFNDKSNAIHIYHEDIKNHHKSIYRKSMNDIDPSSGMSILNMLLRDQIIFRDYYSKEEGKVYSYYINREFLNNELINEIHLQYVTNLKSISNKAFDKNISYPNLPDNFLQLRNESTSEIKNIVISTRKPDNYILVDPDVKLSTLAEDILYHGTLGSNYLSKRILTAFLDTCIEKLKYLLSTGSSSTNILGYISSSYISDKHKLAAAKSATSLTMYNETILYHTAPLRVSYTGRFYECDNLGTTQYSRELKYKNYDDISKLIGDKIYNYDIRASQFAAILAYGKKYNMSFDTIYQYVNDKNFKYELADKIGISYKLLKQLLLSMLFGARPVIIESRDNDAFYTSFEKHGITNILEMRKITEKFNLETKDIFKDIKRWFELAEYIRDNEDDNILTNKNYMTNGITTVNKSKLSKIKELSSFLLQGMESYFVIYLINLAQWTEYKYYFLSYEFDGLITLGPIPEEAITRAKEVSGFTTAILEEKPIY